MVRPRSGRRTPWDRLRSDPDVAVIWERSGQRFVGHLGGVPPAMLREPIRTLLTMAEYRLAQHERGALRPIDPRLHSVLELRRGSRARKDGELEMLIPMANRYRRALALVPDEGSTIELVDITDRCDVGVTALDLVQIFDRWLLALRTGERLPLGPLLGPGETEVFATARDWLYFEFVEPLRPVSGDPASRFPV